MRLCRHGFADKAFDLTTTHFRSHFTEDNPLERDIIHQNINLANYFYKSLVEYGTPKSSVDFILTYTNQRQVQSEADPCRHLKTALYHSLLAENTVQLNLSLVAELQKFGLGCKLNYFMPLIARQIARFDEEIPKTDCISSHVEFKRLESLIRIVKFDYECEISTEILNQILSWLRFDADNHPKPHVNFTSLIDLFKSNRFNSIVLFNCCAYKILNYRIAYMRKNQLHSKFNMSPSDVRIDFSDLSGLIEKLRVTSIEIPILDKINNYLNNLIESKLEFIDVGDLANDPVLKTLRLLNERASSRNLAEVNRRLKEYIRIKGGKS